VLARDAKNVDALEIRCKILTLEGKSLAALKVANMLVQFHPKLARSFAERGNFYHQIHDNKKALADYNKAIALDKTVPLYYRGRGCVYERLGQQSKARADFNKAVKLAAAAVAKSPFPFVELEGLAAAYLDRGDHDKAIATCNRGLQVHPKAIEFYSLRGDAHAYLEHHDQAISDYTRVIEWRPKDYDAFTRLGSSLLAKGEYAQAIAKFEHALQLLPTYEEALRKLAWLHATCPDAKFRDGNKALKLATAACKLTGHREPAALAVLAAAHAELGHFAEAIAWQQKVLADPGVIGPQSAQKRRAMLEAFEAGQAYRDDLPKGE
jgi:tetratricopeptide (TPR) repeat protein